MLEILSPLLGLVSIIFITANTVFWCTIMYPLFAMKTVVPFLRIKNKISSCMIHVAEAWISCNNQYIRHILRPKFRISLPPSLQSLEATTKTYLVISNHQSWVDILSLQFVFNRKIPFFRFFLKDELKWVPFIGVAWKALDYPFMKRYSKDTLAKFPELKLKDFQAAKMACEKLRGRPASILVFAEGTRFTTRKQSAQQSPFKYLLKPKAGGITYVLDAMNSQLNTMLDITVAYPQNDKSFWSFLCGKIQAIYLEANEINIPEKFLKGEINLSSELRAEFEVWINDIWKAKDLRLSQILTAQ